jgi:hypothetical protein
MRKTFIFLLAIMFVSSCVDEMDRKQNFILEVSITQTLQGSSYSKTTSSSTRKIYCPNKSYSEMQTKYKDWTDYEHGRGSDMYITNYSYYFYTTPKLDLKDGAIIP